MNICKYIYCRNLFDSHLDNCSICGYPVNEDKLKNIDFVKSQLPDIPVDSIIDMHQIIPDSPNMVDVQLFMMEKINIKKALLQSVPNKVTSICGNKKLLEIKNNYDAKFWVSHFMDPRHPFATRRLKQYKGLGIKVIKLLPCLGYEPDNPKWHRFWHTMEKLELIAMVHTGFITARHKKEEHKNKLFLSSKFGNPILFDILARKYPELQFILCHTGGLIWTEAAVQMINQHDNAWGDISGFGLLALKKIVQNRMSVDWSKLFWGNDSSPYTYPFNLNLLLHTLKEGNSSYILPKLLYENALDFSKKFSL
jgi:predicted TIM-barrel fold metal-dependent hydrolase